MDINSVRGVMTVVWMVAFIGIVWWAYHPRSKARFDEAANLPFADQKTTTKVNNKDDQE